MKNRGFAHTTIAGIIDITSRAYYRQLLAEIDEELDKKESQLNAQDNSIREAAKAYNAKVAELEAEKRKVAVTELAQKRAEGRAEEAERSLAAMMERHSELQTAYNGAKLRLQRFERRKGSNGRFVKRNEPAEE